MLRSHRQVRPLGNADRDEALELCAADPAANCYVAARILETDLDRFRGALLGYAPEGRLRSVAWSSANLVPVACDDEAADAYAARLRRQRSGHSSIFGPGEQVRALWDRLAPYWRRPLDLRPRQPLLVVGPDEPLGVAPDPRVRPGRLDEIDIIAPAAAAMFTEEIGYAPFTDASGRVGYWNACRSLVRRGRSFVVVEDGIVVFKAEVGSVGVGAAQVQGVWVDPRFRGMGIAAPAMAAVVEQVRAHIAPLVTLYVNDYNAPALATYERVGFRQVDTFATILL